DCRLRIGRRRYGCGSGSAHPGARATSAHFSRGAGSRLNAWTPECLNACHRVVEDILGAPGAGVEADDALLRTGGKGAAGPAHIVAVDSVPYVQNREAIGRQP